MKKVNDILKVKGHDVWSVAPGASLYDAAYIMADKKVGALTVLEGSKLVGIISEVDFTKHAVLKGLSPHNTSVKDVMSTRVLYVQPDQDIENCMILMTEKRTRHLPVLDEGELVGLISIGDVVKLIINEQQFTIEQLEHYIAS